MFQLDQSTSQQAFLQSKYPPDKLFYTSEDHVAGGPLDLALSKGHLVGVLVKKDPMGNSSRWFVDNGGTVMMFLPHFVSHLIEISATCQFDFL